MLINIPDLDDDTDADSGDINSRVASILSAINGNIDADNLADSAVGSAQIENEAVIAAKVKDGEITVGKLATSIQNNGLKTQYAFGQLGLETAIGLKSITSSTTNGMTLQNTNTRLRCDVPGIYYITASQLVNFPGGQQYWNILKNGTSVACDYLTGPQFKTLTVSVTISLVANDYIEVQQTAPITACWGSTHSTFSAFKISN